MIELQSIVDSLATRLGRAAVIDDAGLHTMAHGDISQRPRVAACAYEQGIKDAEGPVRVPGNPDINFESAGNRTGRTARYGRRSRLRHQSLVPRLEVVCAGQSICIRPS